MVREKDTKVREESVNQEGLASLSFYVILYNALGKPH